MLLLALLLIGTAFIVFAGYIVSSQLVWSHWADSEIIERHWNRIAAYAIASVVAVAIVARYFGFLVGAAIGVIPALPLYHATKGGVGFWYIAFGGEEDPINNVAASWIAFLGMLAFHWIVAFLLQRAKEPFSHRMLRWKWIATTPGMFACIALAVTSIAVTSAILQAIHAF